MRKKRISITLNAPATLSLAAIAFVATLLGIITGGKLTTLLFATYHSSLKDPFTYLRFFTHIFGHSGWSHFFGNVSYILLLGPMLEEKHGSRELIEIMAITAFVTGLINYILFPHVALCGASGVVFAFIVLASFTGFRQGEIPLTFILVAAIYLGQQVVEGLFVNDNISNMAHIVGGAVGAVAGYLLNVNRRRG